MTKKLSCPICNAQHELYLAKTGWLVCSQCDHLLKINAKSWFVQGKTPRINWSSSSYFIGQTGALRQRPFRIVGCMQFCLAEDLEDAWFEWILAFTDGSFVVLVDVVGEPLRFFAQRRQIRQNIPDFSKVEIGQSVGVETFHIDVYERSRSIVLAFAGEIHNHQPPVNLQNYIDGYYNQYIVGITYEFVPMICFGVELKEGELIFDEWPAQLSASQESLA